jgi:hypothetical protein
MSGQTSTSAVGRRVIPRPEDDGHGSFEVESDGTDRRGRLRFQQGTDRFRAREMSALSIARDGRSAWLAGVGDDGRTFLAYVEDAGEEDGSDLIRLWINGVR